MKFNDNLPFDVELFNVFTEVGKPVCYIVNIDFILLHTRAGRVKGLNRDESVNER